MGSPTSRMLVGAARRARTATRQRDDLVRKMRTEGATLRAIGEAAGLSHTAITKILAR